MRFRQADGLIFDDMDGQFWVYHAEHGQFFALNVTGVRLWGALAEWVTEDALCEMLVKGFNAPSEVARTDIQQFVETLEVRGLIQRESNFVNAVSVSEGAAP